MSALPSEYVAALCHMRDGNLEPFDSVRIEPSSRTEIVRMAEEWAISAAATCLLEPTWLQVNHNGVGIYGRKIGDSLA
jgi:hypothetical protein